MEKLKDKKFVAGLKQTKKAVLKGEAYAVYIACDADVFAASPLEELCKKNEVEVIRKATMKELAGAFGIEVPTAAAALVKDA